MLIIYLKKKKQKSPIWTMVMHPRFFKKKKTLVVGFAEQIN